MGLFSSKKPPLLGIDISPTAVKLLELRQQRGRRFRVERYAAEMLPAGAIIENRIADAPAVVLSIKRALKQSGTKNKQAVIAVPSTAVITKTMQLPKGLSERELESMVELEAGQHIPFSSEEVNIDFDVLGQSQEADKVDVFLAASRSDRVNERVAVLEDAGLQVHIVDVESLAIERACQKLLRDSQPTAVLDIGAHTTIFYVMQNGQLVYSRELDFGGQQLTDEIQQRYGLSTAEADNAKRMSNLPEDYPFQVLEPFKQKMATQVNRAMQLYASTHSGDRLGNLLLAGGTVLLPGAVQAIQEQVSVPVSLISPFHGVKTSRKVKLARIQSNAPAMLVAFGLALRGMG